MECYYTEFLFCEAAHLAISVTQLWVSELNWIAQALGRVLSPLIPTSSVVRPSHSSQIVGFA